MAYKLPGKLNYLAGVVEMVRPCLTDIYAAVHSKGQSSGNAPEWRLLSESAIWKPSSRIFTEGCFVTLLGNCEDSLRIGSTSKKLSLRACMSLTLDQATAQQAWFVYSPNSEALRRAMIDARSDSKKATFCGWPFSGVPHVSTFVDKEPSGISLRRCQCC